MQQDDGRTAVASLNDVVERGARNRLADAALPGVDGAHAALETFYHAFNAR